MTAVRTRRVIDTGGADAVIAAAEGLALKRGHRVVMAVVDPSGELIAMRRTPGARIASSRVAVDKARIAAIFVRPSREMEEQVTGGRLGACWRSTSTPTPTTMPRCRTRWSWRRAS